MTELAKVPEDLNALIRAAAALRHAGRVHESVIELAALRDRHPDHLALRGELAASLRHGGRHAEALAEYEAMQRIAPGNVASRNAWVDTLFEAGRTIEATAALTAALFSDPANPGLLLRKGSMLRQTQRIAESVALLTALRDAHPGHTWVRHELSVSLRQAGRPAEALAESDAILAQEPGNVHARGARLATLIDLGRHAEALAEIEAVLTDQPHNLNMQIRKGSILRSLGSTADSVAHLTALRDRHPNDVTIRHELSFSLRQASRRLDALAESEAILRLQPGHLNAQSARIDTLLELGQHDRALAAMDEALEADPSNVQLQTRKGAALRAAQRIGDSVAHLTALRDSHPDNPTIRHELSFSLRQAGRPAEAMAESDAVLAMQPGHVQARNARIDTLIDLGRHADALAALDTVLEREPGNLHLQIRKGAALRAAQRAGESAAHLANLRDLHPDNTSIRHELSYSLRQAGRLVEALAESEAVLALQPGYVHARTARIDMLIELGRHADALADMDVALSVDPGNLHLQIRKGAALRGAQRASDSVALLTRLRDENPDNTSIRHELSYSLRQTGRPVEALAESEAILALQPNHVHARTARVDTLIELGRHQTAMAAIEAALADDPGHLHTLIRKGAALRAVQNTAGSVAHLSALRDLHPENVAIRHELSYSLRQGGRLAEALAESEAILALQPAHLHAARARVETLGALEDLDALSTILAAELQQGRGDDDSGRRLQSAWLVAIILPKLPPDAARPALTRAAPLIEAQSQLLPLNLLWSVWRSADLVGLAALLPLTARALLERQPLGIWDARGMLAYLHQGGTAGWIDLARAIEGRLSPTDAWVYRMELVALTDNAVVALQHRKLGVRPEPSPHVAMQMSQRLREAGRVGVAARYLRLAQRRWPDSPHLTETTIRALIDAGFTDQARAMIRTVASAIDAGMPALRAVLMRTLLAIDDIEPALDVAGQIEDPPTRRAILPLLYRILLTRGRTEAADAIEAENRATLRAQQINHYSLSFEGCIANDRLISAGSAADVRVSVPQAARRIETWRGEGPKAGHSSVPLQVMQYWNTAEPPEAIQTLMASWQQAPGITYRRYDRRSARHYLRERLGQDWLLAFNAARMPAEEADFFRLCWLMLEGGLYVDSDDRLLCDAAQLIGQVRGLTACMEEIGAVANNIIFAPPRHPVIIWAAAAARRALAERHTDSVWTKTGPGLLTRAIAQYLDRLPLSEAPDLTLHPQYWLGGKVQFHVPLPYKRTRAYWNTEGIGGTAAGLVGAYQAKCSSG